MGQWLALKRGTEDARGPETTQDPPGWENKNHAPVALNCQKDAVGIYDVSENLGNLLYIYIWWLLMVAKTLVTGGLNNIFLL